MALKVLGLITLFALIIPNQCAAETANYSEEQTTLQGSTKVFTKREDSGNDRYRKGDEGCNSTRYGVGNKTIIKSEFVTGGDIVLDERDLSVKIEESGIDRILNASGKIEEFKKITSKLDFNDTKSEEFLLNNTFLSLNETIEDISYGLSHTDLLNAVVKSDQMKTQISGLSNSDLPGDERYTFHKEITNGETKQSQDTSEILLDKEKREEQNMSKETQSIKNNNIFIKFKDIEGKQNNSEKAFNKEEAKKYIANEDTKQGLDNPEITLNIVEEEEERNNTNFNKFKDTEEKQNNLEIAFNKEEAKKDIANEDRKQGLDNPEITLNSEEKEEKRNVSEETTQNIIDQKHVNKFEGTEQGEISINKGENEEAYTNENKKHGLDTSKIALNEEEDEPNANYDRKRHKNISEIPIHSEEIKELNANEDTQRDPNISKTPFYKEEEEDTANTETTQSLIDYKKVNKSEDTEQALNYSEKRNKENELNANKDSIQNIPNYENIETKLKIPDNATKYTKHNIPNYANIQTNLKIPDNANTNTKQNISNYANIGTKLKIPDNANKDTKQNIPKYAYIETKLKIPDHANIQTKQNIPYQANRETKQNTPDLANLNNYKDTKEGLDTSKKLRNKEDDEERVQITNEKAAENITGQRYDSRYEDIKQGRNNSKILDKSEEEKFARKSSKIPLNKNVGIEERILENFTNIRSLVNNRNKFNNELSILGNLSVSNIKNYSFPASRNLNSLNTKNSSSSSTSINVNAENSSSTAPKNDISFNIKNGSVSILKIFNSSNTEDSSSASRNLKTFSSINSSSSFISRKLRSLINENNSSFSPLRKLGNFNKENNSSTVPGDNNSASKPRIFNSSDTKDSSSTENVNIFFRPVNSFSPLKSRKPNNSSNENNFTYSSSKNLTSFNIENNSPVARQLESLIDKNFSHAPRKHNTVNIEKNRSSSESKNLSSFNTKNDSSSASGKYSSFNIGKRRGNRISFNIEQNKAKNVSSLKIEHNSTSAPGNHDTFRMEKRTISTSRIPSNLNNIKSSSSDHFLSSIKIKEDQADINNTEIKQRRTEDFLISSKLKPKPLDQAKILKLNNPVTFFNNTLINTTSTTYKSLSFQRQKLVSEEMGDHTENAKIYNSSKLSNNTGFHEENKNMPDQTADAKIHNPVTFSKSTIANATSTSHKTPDFQHNNADKRGINNSAIKEDLRGPHENSTDKQINKSRGRLERVAINPSASGQGDYDKRPVDNKTKLKVETVNTDAHLNGPFDGRRRRDESLNETKNSRRNQFKVEETFPMQNDSKMMNEGENISVSNNSSLNGGSFFKVVGGIKHTKDTNDVKQNETKVLDGIQETRNFRNSAINIDSKILDTIKQINDTKESKIKQDIATDIDSIQYIDDNKEGVHKIQQTKQAKNNSMKTNHTVKFVKDIKQTGHIETRRMDFKKNIDDKIQTAEQQNTEVNDFLSSQILMNAINNANSMQISNKNKTLETLKKIFLHTPGTNLDLHSDINSKIILKHHKNDMNSNEDVSKIPANNNHQNQDFVTDIRLKKDASKIIINNDHKNINILYVSSNEDVSKIISKNNHQNPAILSDISEHKNHKVGKNHQGLEAQQDILYIAGEEILSSLKEEDSLELSTNTNEGLSSLKEGSLESSTMPTTDIEFTTKENVNLLKETNNELKIKNAMLINGEVDSKIKAGELRKDDDLSINDETVLKIKDVESSNDVVLRMHHANSSTGVVDPESAELKIKDTDLSKHINLKITTGELNKDNTDSKIEGIELSNSNIDSKIKKVELSNNYADSKIEEIDLGKSNADSEIKDVEFSNNDADLPIKDVESNKHNADSKIKNIELSKNDADSKTINVELSKNNTDSQIKDVKLNKNYAESKTQKVELSQNYADSEIKEVELRKSNADSKIKDVELSNNDADLTIKDVELSNNDADLTIKDIKSNKHNSDSKIKNIELSENGGDSETKNVELSKNNADSQIKNVKTSKTDAGVRIINTEWRKDGRNSKLVNTEIKTEDVAMKIIGVVSTSNDNFNFEPDKGLKLGSRNYNHDKDFGSLSRKDMKLLEEVETETESEEIISVKKIINGINLLNNNQKKILHRTERVDRSFNANEKDDFSTKKITGNELRAKHEELGYLIEESSTLSYKDLISLNEAPSETSSIINDYLRTLKDEPLETSIIIKGDLASSIIVNEDLSFLKEEPLETSTIINEDLSSLKVDPLETSIIVNEDLRFIKGEPAETSTIINEDLSYLQETLLKPFFETSESIIEDLTDISVEITETSENIIKDLTHTTATLTETHESIIEDLTHTTEEFNKTPESIIEDLTDISVESSKTPESIIEALTHATAKNTETPESIIEDLTHTTEEIIETPKSIIEDLTDISLKITETPKNIIKELTHTTAEITETPESIIEDLTHTTNQIIETSESIIEDLTDISTEITETPESFIEELTHTTAENIETPESIIEDLTHTTEEITETPESIIEDTDTEKKTKTPESVIEELTYTSENNGKYTHIGEGNLKQSTDNIRKFNVIDTSQNIGERCVPKANNFASMDKSEMKLKNISTNSSQRYTFLDKHQNRSNAVNLKIIKKVTQTSEESSNNPQNVEQTTLPSLSTTTEKSTMQKFVDSSDKVYLSKFQNASEKFSNNQQNIEKARTEILADRFEISSVIANKSRNASNKPRNSHNLDFLLEPKQFHQQGAEVSSEQGSVINKNKLSKFEEISLKLEDTIQGENLTKILDIIHSLIEEESRLLNLISKLQKRLTNPSLIELIATKPAMIKRSGNPSKPVTPSRNDTPPTADSWRTTSAAEGLERVANLLRDQTGEYTTNGSDYKLQESNPSTTQTTLTTPSSIDDQSDSTRRGAGKNSNFHSTTSKTPAEFKCKNCSEGEERTGNGATASLANETTAPTITTARAATTPHPNDNFLFTVSTFNISALQDGLPDYLATDTTQEMESQLDGVMLIPQFSEGVNSTVKFTNWPVKKEAVVEGDIVLGGLMMVHEREDSITCGPVMPQGGIQALEAMLYTLDRLNQEEDMLLPNITLGAHILDDCDKDTYGLEMAVDFIKGK